MKWIPVADRLPEVRDASVIVHFTNGSIEMVHIQDWIRDGLCELNIPITHWMDFPNSPYKED